MKITVSDALGFGYCVRGQKAFARRNDIDWHEFVKNGIEDQVLLSTGDAMAQALVEKTWDQKKHKQLVINTM